MKFILTGFYSISTNFGAGINTFLNPVLSKALAFSGQWWAQIPQPMHLSTFTIEWSATNSVASIGHFSTQIPQPLHFSLLTVAKKDVNV